jgi:serine/threonine protein kinase
MCGYVCCGLLGVPQFDEKLGNGAYKEVFLAYDTETGKEVAWNTVTLARLPPTEKKRIRMETEILKELDHPHIINFFHVWENPARGQWRNKHAQLSDDEHARGSHGSRFSLLASLRSNMFHHRDRNIGYTEAVRASCAQCETEGDQEVVSTDPHCTRLSAHARAADHSSRSQM